VEGDDEWDEVYSGPAPSTKLAKLQPDADYTFRVIAVNSVGPGEASPELQLHTPPAVEKAATKPVAQPPAAPSAPSLVNRNQTSLRLEWRVAGVRKGVTFSLEVDDGGGYREVFSGGATSHELSGLRPGKTYKTRVTAANRAGKSAPSPVASFQTVEPSAKGLPPSAPAAPTLLTATKNQLKLGWDDRTGVSQWRLEMAKGVGGSFTKSYQGDDVTTTLLKLDAGATYSFRLQAINKFGASNYSEQVVFTTLKPTKVNWANMILAAMVVLTLLVVAFAERQRLGFV